MIKTGILTISDKGSRKERIDATGPAIKEVLDKEIYDVVHYKIVSDEENTISKELLYMCDVLKLDLVLTNGGDRLFKKRCNPRSHFKGNKKTNPRYS